MLAGQWRRSGECPIFAPLVPPGGQSLFHIRVHSRLLPIIGFAVKVFPPFSFGGSILAALI
jgi:hypothetical protein